MALSGYDLNAERLQAIFGRFAGLEISFTAIPVPLYVPATGEMIVLSEQVPTPESGVALQEMLDMARAQGIILAVWSPTEAIWSSASGFSHTGTVVNAYIEQDADQAWRIAPRFDVTQIRPAF